MIKQKYIIILSPKHNGNFLDAANLVYKNSKYPFVAKVVNQNISGLVFENPNDCRDCVSLWSTYYFNWKYVNLELKYLL